MEIGKCCVVDTRKENQIDLCILRGLPFSKSRGRVSKSTDLSDLLTVAAWHKSKGREPLALKNGQSLYQIVGEKAWVVEPKFIWFCTQYDNSTAKFQKSFREKLKINRIVANGVPFDESNGLVFRIVLQLYGNQ